MNNESDSDLDERIEILKQKYLQRRNPGPDAAADDGGAGHTRDIYRTLPDRTPSSRRPDRAEDEPRDEDDSLEETNVFCTETDVTLPSDLVRSWSCSVLNSRGKGVVDQSSGAAAAVHVYQEMLHIHEKLQAERLSQQVWAVQLCERERGLQQRETVFQQQQQLSVLRLRVQQEELRRVQNLQQQYQQEKSDLEAALKQKNKENKRMKASFDSMKELNDSMKKQLNEVSEQNRKLEHQSRRVQARLENLQRKPESFTTHRSRETANDPKPSKPEKPPSNKAAVKGSAHGPSLKLLALLLDWLVEGQLMEVRDGPRSSPQERCARVCHGCFLINRFAVKC